LSFQGIIECEHCRVHDIALDRGDGVPFPWYTLGYPDGPLLRGPLHFCSAECLMLFLYRKEKNANTANTAMRDALIKLSAEIITEGGNNA